VSELGLSPYDAVRAQQRSAANSSVIDEPKRLESLSRAQD
jgi:hypothetical protein